MAGLLAARMLARRGPHVVEKQESLPNNHHALLRFRTNAVSTVTGIPFKQVQVIKSVFGGNGLHQAILYARKVIGRPAIRSIIDTAPATRYIAPPDFIKQLAMGSQISFDIDAGMHYDDLRDLTVPVVSTVPMSMLMDWLDYRGPRPEFRFKRGVVWKATVPDCDIYATIYFPSTLEPFYRASITGDQLVVELATDDELSHSPVQWEGYIKTAFGLEGIELSPWVVKNQPYAKIDAATDREKALCRTFMHWATVNHNVYSLGRFATWRAGLLLDDLVQDVQKIDRWIGAGHYDTALEM